VSEDRLEAFSDGVIAILITIMVLGLQVPVGDTSFEALAKLSPIFISYVLSFVNLGIYWNNHHHLLQASDSVNGRVLWANLYLLFWLSLFPFTTAWMGENHFASLPTATYGIVALLAGGAYTFLVRSLRAVPGQASALMEASGADAKGTLSVGLYALGIIVALLQWPNETVGSMAAFGLYVAVAVMWFIPDRRVERALGR